ncbi:AAA family ATPase [Epidermidibacterium keratini]|uniref:AAA family ATPase n=1 Tax=Epidermidibacterium keratini TaxID=1891644 RepID=A0A7L4YJG5_9ACTN|nr:replication-associated recombination protein A [Epidermidibacterium keratini]QHB99052.1 AAA family ATPase [Epidermidibacterium keratini]
MSTLFEIRSGDEPEETGDTAAPAAFDPSAPLAVRMRPRTLDEVVGQSKLIGSGTPLRRIVEGDTAMSVILYGPPGTGKTTLAHVIGAATGRRFVELSALNAGVKDVRAVIEEARKRRQRGGEQTVLFIDEVHRFSKTQQDSLLAAVEQRTVALIAATTENPFFALVSPLLSRSLLLTLEGLSDDDVATVIDRALTHERGLDGAFELTDDAREHLVRTAGGDARRALTSLEAAADIAAGDGIAQIDAELVARAIDVAAVKYDRDGDQHYDVASALIKSIRGSDVDAALHYLARMIVAGEDPRFIARRLVISASEDIGMADPSALQTAVAAMQAVQFIGMPEGRIPLAEAVVHLACAPKSNAAYKAIDAAIAEVRDGKIGAVPAHLRDGHYSGAKKLGHAQGYIYPHNLDEGVAGQQYAPDGVDGTVYYEPTGRGVEANIATRLAKIRSMLRDRK